MRHIGRGGMGTVYEAWDAATQRSVALKLVLSGIDSPGAREEFLREGKLAASLNHRNTVYVLGSLEIGGQPVIVMELVRGKTLEQIVRERGPLPAAVAVNAILQVVDGLEAANRLGILHCDMKPSNCFIDSDGTIKVGDFGLAVTSRTASSGGVVVQGGGTPGYAAPEQIRGEPLDARADIYSLGVTLYFLLTARLPFGGGDANGIWKRVLSDPPPSRSVMRGVMPAPLAEIVARCLAKQRARRFQNYGKLREALTLFRLLWIERRSAFPLRALAVLAPAVGMAVLVLGQFLRRMSPAHAAILTQCVGLGAVALTVSLVVLWRNDRVVFRLRCIWFRIGCAIHRPINISLTRAQQKSLRQPSRPTFDRRGSEEGEKIGPYRVVGAFGSGGQNSFLIGYDPALERQVWLKMLPAGADPPPQYANDLRRPTRARLLGSARGPKGGWDAYEAIVGEPLVNRIHRRQQWGQVRTWLAVIAGELAKAEQEHSVPPRLEPDQVWIAESGSPVLLDFPAPGLVPMGAGEEGPARCMGSAQVFMKRLALMALEGRDVSASEADRRGVEAPVPTHVTGFLGNLGRYKAAADAAKALAGLMNKQAKVRRTSRIGAALSGVLLMFVGVFVAAIVFAVLDFLGIEKRLAPQLTISSVLAAIAGGFCLVVVTAAMGRWNICLSQARLRLVTTMGQRPSRLRHGFRTILVWAPFLLLTFALVLHLPVVTASAGVLILVGVCWASIFPERGLHDLLSGTVVVVNE